MAVTGGLLPVGIILILGAIASRKKKRAPAQTGPTSISTCPPFPFMKERIDTAAHDIILEFQTEDVGQISLEVARRVYPESPDLEPLRWPPPQGAEAQICLLEQIQLRVNRIVATLADDIANSDQPGVPTPPEDMDWPGMSEDWIKSDPIPGYWYQVVQGDSLSGIAQKMLRAALAAAGGPVEIMARDSTARRRLIVSAINSIECSPINDGLYGTADAHHYAPHLRGISLNRVHADNAARVSNGQAPRRAVTGVRSHDGTGGFLPLLWLPRWSMPALADAVPRVVVEPEGFWPENGLSGSWPPPPYVDLGAENVPSGGWGCEPYTSPVPWRNRG
jgi:hypothetical protein